MRPAPALLALLGVLAGCDLSDRDGDGFDASEDCNDEDPTIHPGAEEICGNGVDEDCLPGAPTCRQTGTSTLGPDAPGVSGSAAGAHLGRALAAIGDIDGDGFEDILAGAPGDDQAGDSAGLALLLFGAPNGVDLGRSIALLGAEPGDLAGTAVGGGRDLTGDGLPDLWVGAPGAGPRDALMADGGTGLAAGAIYIVPGPFSASGHAVASLGSAAHHVVRGGDPTACVGRVAASADLTGDGVDDLVSSSVCFGSYHFVHPHGNLAMLVDGPGQVALLDGPFTADRSQDDARLTWTGDEDWDRLGASVAVTQDLDGDGLSDLAIGAPDYYGADWINLPATARVLTVSTAGAGARTTTEALGIATGGCCGSQRHEAAGTTLAAADIDADGVRDLLVGAPRLDDFGVQGGALAFLGGLRGVNDALVDGAWIAGPPQDAALPSRAGAALLAGFDLDCDGALDLALGAPDDAATGPRGGGVRIHYGAVGDYTLLGDDAAASLHLRSALDNEQLGASLASADVDGDGCSDLVVGVPEARDAGLQAGAVRILLGSGP